MPRLILINPEFADQTCELPDWTFTLGRGPQNHIIVLDESVSAQHCELLVHGREVIVRERGSRNGTFINGVRVKIQRGVYHGQLLRFGRVEARLEIEAPENDDATSITAMDHYRSRMPRLMQPRRNRISFTAAACILGSLIITLASTWIAARDLHRLEVTVS